MVKQASRRVIPKDATKNAINNQHIQNIKTTFTLYKLPKEPYNISHFTIFSFNFMYTMTNLLLLSFALFTAKNYYWYTHLYFFGILIIYSYTAGFAYHKYFSKPFMTCAYISTLSLIFSTLFKAGFVYLNRLFEYVIVDWILSIVELMISSYIIHANLVSQDEMYDQRKMVTTRIFIFVIQVLGTYLGYYPFRYIVIFPKSSKL